MKEILVNAQWQGGADIRPYLGAQELTELYLAETSFKTIPVSPDEGAVAAKVNGIVGFETLRRQIQDAFALLSADTPDKVFTLGGGCDADVPSLAYLNEKYRGDLTILWLDAHGDLNTPEESSSSLFYGMPLRAAMDSACFGLLKNPCPVRSSQIIHIGGRDFDAAEEEFIRSSGIRRYTVSDIRAGRLPTVDSAKHVYIHLDLDVLDPSAFPHTPLPVADGLTCEELYEILEAFKDKLVGFGMYEYIPLRRKVPFIEKLLSYGLTL